LRGWKDISLPTQQALRFDSWLVTRQKRTLGGGAADVQGRLGLLPDAHSRDVAGAHGTLLTQ